MRIECSGSLLTRAVFAALVLIVLAPVGASAQAKQPTETKTAVRTLEAIKIEGEIDIPQVLFITSRDHPRFSDGLRERYRASALELGREVVFPSRFRPLLTHPQMQK